MLTLCEFNALEHIERIQAVEDHGVYLEVFRRSEGCKIALFALHGYYVEVYLKTATDNIIKVKAFTDMRRLEMYLEQINITPLLSAF
jgi:hypothetical protein